MKLRMENPREEVKDVVLGLLQKPTLKGQAEVIRRYCTEDIEFYYLYFNVKGAREMTVIYQVAQVCELPKNMLEHLQSPILE